MASQAAINKAKTVCPKGHPFDFDNTYIHPDGDKRGCRKCRTAAAARYKARRSA